jgi:hypothetical protein
LTFSAVQEIISLVSEQVPLRVSHQDYFLAFCYCSLIGIDMPGQAVGCEQGAFIKGAGQKDKLFGKPFWNRIKAE